MSRIQWDPRLYLRYERERTQPSIDLVSRIDLDSPEEIIDLGCGPGNSTKVLQNRWPAARLTGLDSSPAMIEKAKESPSNIIWKVATIESWSEPEKYDLAFANASLHWIPDHELLMKKLVESLKPAGILAFQMPALYNQPAADAPREVSESADWTRYELSKRNTIRTHTPREYYGWLAPIAAEVTIWETVYFHVMKNHQAIVDFYSGTGLKAYLEGLPTAELRDRFIASVLQVYEKLFPVQKNGLVLFPFRRIFVIAERGL